MFTEIRNAINSHVCEVLMSVAVIMGSNEVSNAWPWTCSKSTKRRLSLYIVTHIAEEND